MTRRVACPLLDVDALTVVYGRGRRRTALRATDGVSFSVQERQTIGVVGESGSGKTTIGRAVLGLAPVASGRISFAGREIHNASLSERRKLSSQLQAVFQDPYSSLNPTRTVEQTLAETLRVHNSAPRSEIRERVIEILHRVGLGADAAQRYPAHFSGGQRQRIAIARALIARPRLVICDEPTSALDLSVQAQVLNLLGDLQDEMGLSYMFISHDLAVVRHVAHEILVVYHGRVMEYGDAEQVYVQPVHPYTQALLASAPVPNPSEQRKRMVQRRSRVLPVSTRFGSECCPFAPRCVFAAEVCYEARPSLERSDRGPLVACHRWREIAEEQTEERARGGVRMLPAKASHQTPNFDGLSGSASPTGIKQRSA